MKLKVLIRNFISLIIFFVCPFCLYSQTDTRLALIIGNKDYSEDDMTLKNPINDANAMETVLEECNFKVIKVVNGTKEAIEKAVENFTESLQNYDVGLFYYSGHGVEVISKGNRMNFIVPVNVSSQITEADVEYKCVSSEWIQAKMAEAGAYNKTNILIFDACRDNPFRRLRRSMEKEVWSPPFLIPTGVITCFSASPNEFSLDGKGQNGLYTSILLKHIRTPNIMVEEVFKRVRIDIKGLGQQEPVEISKLTTSFYFFRKGNTLDTDEDGIPDDIDQCKYEKGLAELNGCPYDNTILVEGGVFNMGSPDAKDNAPIHSVSLKTFYISKYEVTFEEYDAFCDATSRKKPHDENYGRGKRPVFNVNWYDAIEYCNWLSKKYGFDECYRIDKTRKDPNNLNDADNLKWIVTCDFNATGYRLPSEAEWEFAARGGNLGKNTLYSGGDQSERIAWFSGDNTKKTMPVGQKKANELGLFDMSGNVWEWCWDIYAYYDKPTSKFSARIDRGGSWGDPGVKTTVRGAAPPHYRGQDEPYHLYGHIGFRMARSKP